MEHNPNVVLSSDHPLLERFQTTLKAHLLRVQAKLEEECAGLDFSYKRVQQDQEEVGAALYDVQQQAEYQKRQLDNLLNEINIKTEKRNMVEKNVQTAKQEFETIKAKMDELNSQYQENQVNLENMTHFESHLIKWQKEAENNLKVATRITKKDGQDRLVKIEEKRRMDLFTLGLESEVRKREIELIKINQQIGDTESVMETFNKSLTDANADLETLQHEHKRLVQSWREVIVSIQQRDKMLADIHQEIYQENEKQKDLKGHIDGTRRSIQNQSIENEKLEGFLNRLLGDMESLQRQINKETKEIDKINENYSKKLAIWERTEMDIKQSKLEGLLIENNLKDIKKKIESQTKQKIKLEENILDLLQEQISSDKAGQFRAKILRDCQMNRRNTEIMISATENNLSTMLLEMETNRGSVTRYKEIIEKYRQDETEMRLNLDRQEEELKIILTRITLNQRSLDVLAKQMNDMISALGGREVSPEENRILELKQNIIELNEEMKQNQNFWLKLQNHLVNLNDKRSNQTNEIFVGRKQDFIIEQKYHKIESGLEALEFDEKQMQRLIQGLHSKLDLLGSRIHFKSEKGKEKQEECEKSFDKYYQKLRDTEKSLLELKNEIDSIILDLETMKKTVIEKHRELITWEDKHKTIIEVKKYQDEESAVEGEINSMKMEIHRMEIRYAQLKKAQEKLMQDMDNCVIHREKIFTKSLIQEKRFKKGRRANFEDKIEGFKAKLKQTNQEIQMMDKSVHNLNEKHSELENDLRYKINEIDSERRKDDHILMEIEEGQMFKQANLDAIVRNQKRAKRYTNILMKPNMPKCRRSEASTDLLLEKQKEVQEHLSTFLEDLVNDFPDKKFAIARILQSLKDNF